MMNPAPPLWKDFGLRKGNIEGRDLFWFLWLREVVNVLVVHHGLFSSIKRNN
jgi:hypothetical protein